MEEIDIDNIKEVNYTGTGSVEGKFKDGTSRNYSGEELPEILAILNHWTPPTA